MVVRQDREPTTIPKLRRSSKNIIANRFWYEQSRRVCWTDAVVVVDVADSPLVREYLQCSEGLFDRKRFPAIFADIDGMLIEEWIMPYRVR